MHDTGCIDDEAQHDGVEPWRSSGFAEDRLLSDAELDRNREPNEGQTASGVCRFGHDELAQHIATWPGKDVARAQRWARVCKSCRTRPQG